ncbi:MAG: CbtB-domain containing protein [Thaumarchaeota archaeon]|nr:CbtB-domain containing protein [Nitrososphaerota archaeon]
MSTVQVTIESVSVPTFVLGILSAVFLFGMFIVGYDQGHLFSVVVGEQAFDDLYLHELYHDLRHVSGFPCH